MDQEVFYKDQYDKSLAARTEINGSLSTPIGILTALLAGLYFCTTNFDYSDGPALNKWFIAIAILTALLLLIAVTYLVLAFCDFLQGRKYYNINDADILDTYYQDLLDFYMANPPVSPATPETQAKLEFDEYLLAELIRNASFNQATNRAKTALLFQSHKFMICAIISISLLIVPFGIDFGLNKGKEKTQKISIDQALPLDLTIKYQKDTTLRLHIKPEKRHGKANQHR